MLLLVASATDSTRQAQLGSTSCSLGILIMLSKQIICSDDLTSGIFRRWGPGMYADVVCLQKGPAIYTDPLHLERFSLNVDEIVKTPLGITGTVCGVKYATAEQAASFSGGKVGSHPWPSLSRT